MGLMMMLTCDGDDVHAAEESLSDDGDVNVDDGDVNVAEDDLSEERNARGWIGLQAGQGVWESSCREEDDAWKSESLFFYISW